MNNTIVKSKISFWEFLKNNKVYIPVIQRDYAQGRIGKEDLRKNFLNEIHDATKEKPLLLDFVYGVDRDGIQPLDGQQRLTTLWLVHWYISVKKGEKDNADILQKFSYETRISSRNFLEKLCDALRDGTFKTSTSIAEDIQQQTWFSSAWKQDPTIQAMLVMLSGTKQKKEELNEDGIEQVFNGEQDFPEVYFYYLPLEGIKQSDDLYIKMNHRGEQLTNFENFKADLISYMRKHEDYKKYANLESKETCIVNKFDKEWADLFWTPIEWDEIDDLKNSYPEIDELFYRFIKLFLQDKLYVSNVDDKDNLIDILNKDYVPFENYEKIFKNAEILPRLWVVLNNIPKNFNKIVCENNPLLQKEGFVFLTQFKKGKTDIEIETTKDNYQKVVFHALCLYLERMKPEASMDNFKQWLRLSTNIAYSREIPTEVSMITRMEKIDGIAKNVIQRDKNVYKLYLEKYDASDKDDSIQDEFTKINDFAAYVESLEKIEALPLFRGWIDSILKTETKIWITNTIFTNTCKKFDKIYHLFEDNDWNPSKPPLLEFLKAVLVNYSPDAEIYIDLTTTHYGFQKSFNGCLKDAFITTINQLLEGKKVSDIINNYNEINWKTPLIKDKNNKLWEYSTYGRIQTRSSEVLLFSRFKTSARTLPLGKIANYINENSIDISKLESIIDDNTQCIFTLDDNCTYTIQK